MYKNHISRYSQFRVLIYKTDILKVQAKKLFQRVFLRSLKSKQPFVLFHPRITAIRWKQCKLTEKGKQGCRTKAYLFTSAGTAFFKQISIKRTR